MSYFSLRKVIKDNSVDKLKIMLKLNVFNNIYGSKLLHYAIKKDTDINIIKLLVNRISDLNIKNKQGTTYLHRAIKQGTSLEVIKLLIKKKANVNAKNRRGMTPLHLAVEKSVDQDEDDARHNLQVIRFLLQKSANVNAANKNGETPLVFAVKQRKIEVIKMLFQYRANANTKCKIGMRLLFHSVVKDRKNLKIAQLFLKHGAEVNIEDEDRATPLHIAATTTNNVKILSLLLRKGAKIDIKDDFGSTPLGIAAKIPKNYKNVAFLIAKGADVKAKDDHNLTPLHYSVTNNPSMVSTLIKHGAEVNAKGSHGMYPLHMASGSESGKAINVLLKYGADCNLPNDGNETPLCFAIFYGRQSNVKKMLKHCLNVYCPPNVIEELTSTGQRCEESRVPLVLLQKHVIKLKMLNLLSDEDYATWKSEAKVHRLKNFIANCKKQSDNLCKNLICSDRVIRFSDLLTKDLQQVAVYLSVDDVKRQIDRINFDKKYPYYTDMLKARIRKAVKIAKLSLRKYKSVQSILSKLKLPHTVVSKISSYLGDKDVKKLDKICRNIGISI